MTDAPTLFPVEDARPAADDGRDYTGRYHGADPRPTERESGRAVEDRERGPLKPGSIGHRVLAVYARAGHPITAYEAAYRATGDYHAGRRESTRLYERGFLEHGLPMENPAPSGRKRVDSFLVTSAGLAEARRLGPVA